MMVKQWMVAAAAALCFGATQAAVIDFEADAAGGKPNGFASAGFPGVTFTDTAGANLQVNNFGGQGIGQSLAVFDDFDNSALRMDFATRNTTLSLAFGNDDQGFAGEPVFALLELYDGATLVASTLLATNNNDAMDQTISATAAGGFDNARFKYVGAGGANLGRGLIEIVDQIDATVPAPGSLALGGLALLGLAAVRRRA